MVVEEQMLYQTNPPRSQHRKAVEHVEEAEAAALLKRYSWMLISGSAASRELLEEHR